jgi:rubrerythrin
MYSKKVDSDELKGVFKKFAEDEGYHATTLRELINKYPKDQ